MVRPSALLQEKYCETAGLAGWNPLSLSAQSACQTLMLRKPSRAERIVWKVFGKAPKYRWFIRQTSNHEIFRFKLWGSLYFPTLNHAYSMEFDYFCIIMNNPENIYPIFDRMLSRGDKEELLHQKGVMLWFTGLSGSGKSTVAVALERELHRRGLLCRILDGDNIRSGINSNLGFSEEDRRENIRRIAEVSKLFVQTGIITIAAFISPTEELRRIASDIIGAEDFKEIYISTPLEECEHRDVKGLYARARRGEVKNFTGISAPFEAPQHPALSLDTSKLTLEESVSRLLELLGIKD